MLNTRGKVRLSTITARLFGCKYPSQKNHCCSRIVVDGLFKHCIVNCHGNCDVIDKKGLPKCTTYPTRSALKRNTIAENLTRVEEGDSHVTFLIQQVSPPKIQQFQASANFIFHCKLFKKIKYNWVNDYKQINLNGKEKKTNQFFTFNVFIF